MKPYILVLYLAIALPLQSFSQTSFSAEIKTAEYPVTNVHSNCLKHFERSFKNSTNFNWTVTETGYTARFWENNMSYDVRYNKKGRWLSTIRHIPVQHLDEKISKFVLNQYKHYTIFFAQQVTVPQGSVYLVKIEKGNDWKFIKVKRWETEVIGEYIKELASR